MPKPSPVTWRHLDLAEGETIRTHAEAYLTKHGRVLAKDPVASEEAFLRLADRALNPTYEKVPLQRRVLGASTGDRFLTVLTRAHATAPTSDVYATVLALDQRAAGDGPSSLHAGVRHNGVDIWLPIRLLNIKGERPTTQYAPGLLVRSFSKKAGRRPNEVAALEHAFGRCNDYVKDLLPAVRALEAVPITVEYGVALLGLAAVTCLKPIIRARRVLMAVQTFTRKARLLKRPPNVLDVLHALNFTMAESKIPLARAMRVAEAWAVFILAEFTLHAGGRNGNDLRKWPLSGQPADYNIRPATAEEMAVPPLAAAESPPAIPRADEPASAVGVEAHG